MSFTTKVGSSEGLDPTCPDALLEVEPETGATLRTKGRLYALCEVSPSVPSASSLTHELVELVRQEYYYDLSAGIETSLRRAIRQANRRAAAAQQANRDHFNLHLVCVVVVNNELYAVRVGAAQIFLVRRARLFLPGDEPGDLADFVHRTTTRRAGSLGAEQDLLPSVWRQPIEAGDTIVVAAGGLVDALGAEELKSAAVTLHPRSAAEHVRNRAIADGAPESTSSLFIEIAIATGSPTTKVTAVPEFTRPSSEAELAESIRQRVDSARRRIPRLDQIIRRLFSPVANLGRRILGVSLELLPRQNPTLPRSPDTAHGRSRRQYRVTVWVAVVVILIGSLLSIAAYRDYEHARAASDYGVALTAAQNDIVAARRALDAVPRDSDGARQRLESASARLGAASSSPVAEAVRVATLAAEIDRLRDLLSNVLIDLGRTAQSSRPTQLTQTPLGLYAADPGSARLWRVYGDPVTTGVVLQRAVRGVSAPVAVLAQGETIYSVDDARKVWRAEGAAVTDVSPQDANRWAVITGAALFGGNLYVLDDKSGQVWKHEGDAGRFGPGTAFLAQPLAAGGRSIAVDGGVWVVDRNGELLEFRRNPTATTAQRVDLFIRWQGEPVRATAVQALEAQRSIYLLDAPGRRVVQLTRDGRETARVALPATLEEPNAFYVAEAERRIYSVHGGKISVTDLK